MALSSFTVTIITKSDSPFNVIPNAPIEIRERLANGASGNLSLIFSDQAGLNPITQVGFTTNSLGQAQFYAAAADYNAVYDNNGTPVTIAVDVGVTGGILNERFNRLNPATLAIALDDTSLQLDDALNLKEHTATFGGGAIWDVFAAGTFTVGAAITDVFDHNTLPLQLKLRVGLSAEIKEFGGINGQESTTSIQATINGTNVRVEGDGTFTTTGLVIDKKKDINIDELVMTTADKATVIIQNLVTPNVRIEDVTINGTVFSGASGVSDNFAYISTFNSVRPRFRDTTANGGRTAIRIGHEPTGTHTVDAFIDGLHAEGCASFGIEHIESDRTLANNINIGNEGVQIGSHGLRYTGTIKGTTGNVAYGFNIRDRLTTGISIQEGASHNVHGLGVIGNVGESGIQANTAALIDAKSMIPHTIIQDADSDGLNLSNLTHMYFDALVDNPTQKGLRLGGGVAPTTENANMGRVMVIGAQNGAASIASNFNFIDILADTCLTSSPIVISGDFNIVRVLTKNCGDLTVFVTGDHNVVMLLDDGTSPIGLRIDGDWNKVSGLARGDVDLRGNNNDTTGLKIVGKLVVNVGFRNSLRTIATTEGETDPTTGAWKRGDRIVDPTPTAGGFDGRRCTQTGTFSTATDSTGDTDGSTGVITGMTDTSDFEPGHFVNITAGFAAGDIEILSVDSATQITVDANSTSAQANVTIDTSDPVFKTYGAITA